MKKRTSVRLSIEPVAPFTSLAGSPEAVDNRCRRDRFRQEKLHKQISRSFADRYSLVSH